MSDEIPLYPVASTTIGPIPFHSVIAIRFDYLEDENQDPLFPTIGKHFVLTPAKTRELISDLQLALQKLEKLGGSKPSGHFH